MNSNLPPIWHPAWLLPVSTIDIELGLRQLATMLGSGVSILSALRSIYEQTDRPRQRALWGGIENRIRAGGSLSDAMRASRAFGEYVVQLARVGEQSGELALCLSRAAEHLEMHRNIRLMVANALMYPAIATLMAFGVSLYLVAGVIPKIARFIETGGARLPAITRALIDSSNWLRGNAPLLLIIIAGLTAAWLALRRHPAGRETQDALLLRLPVSGRILRISATAVFARGLGMLSDSGVSLLDSLAALEKLMTNRRLSRRIAQARTDVMRGETLTRALEKAPEFLPLLRRMTSVAETSGTLGATLSEVAKFHEQLLVISIKRFSVIIEPLLIIVTGAIVGFVYIAFFMALFSMVSSI